MEFILFRGGRPGVKASMRGGSAERLADLLGGPVVIQRVGTVPSELRLVTLKDPPEGTPVRYQAIRPGWPWGTFAGDCIVYKRAGNGLILDVGQMDVDWANMMIRPVEASV